METAYRAVGRVSIPNHSIGEGNSDCDQAPGIEQQRRQTRAVSLAQALSGSCQVNHHENRYDGH